MSLTAYHILHLSSVAVLLAYTFFAFAAPPETKRRVMMITGVAALLILVTGVGMLHKTRLPMQALFPAWAWVKTACWLGLAALGGLAYRKRDQTNLLMLVGLALAVIAIVMVYARPF